jgi:hypothetical protein
LRAGPDALGGHTVGPIDQDHDIFAAA